MAEHEQQDQGTEQPHAHHRDAVSKESLPLPGQQPCHRQGNADTATHPARLHPLGGMAQQTAWLHHQRLHQPQVGLTIDAGELHYLPGALLKRLQRLALPGVGPVLRPQWLQTGDAPRDTVEVAVVVVQLADDRRRVDQGEAVARRGGDIPLRDMGHVGIRPGSLGDRNVDAAMVGTPEPEGHVLVIVGPGLGDSQLPHGLVTPLHVPEEQQHEQQRPDRQRQHRVLLDA